MSRELGTTIVGGIFFMLMGLAFAVALPALRPTAPAGMLVGIGLFTLGCGRLAVRLNGVYSLAKGIWVRFAGAGAAAIGIGVAIFAMRMP